MRRRRQSSRESKPVHADVNDSGRKAFNMIIPLLLQEQDEDKHHESSSNNAGELEIHSDDEAIMRYYKYEYNAASMVGDHALHATAACDYRNRGNGNHQHDRGGMRLEILRQRMSINC